MPRKYINDNPNSSVEIIILTESQDQDFYPRVIYNIEKEGTNQYKVEKEKEKEDVSVSDDHAPIYLKDGLSLSQANGSEYYVVKDQRRVAGSCYFLDVLCQAQLISDSFKQSVINKEKAIYEARMAEELERRVYELPERDKGLIEAVIVQQHGKDKLGLFVRYNEENRETLLNTLASTNMNMDGMPADFDNYSVLFLNGKKQTSVEELLSGLFKLGLISKKFQRTVLAQESEARVFTQKKCRLNSDFNIEDFELKMQSRLAGLLQQIEYYQNNIPKVKYGEFHSQVPRQLRDIIIEFDKIKSQQIDTAKGLQCIIQHATVMGKQHPIAVAAKKCLNLIMTIHQDDQRKLGF